MNRSGRYALLFAVALATQWLFAHSALAHSLNDSYLTLDASGAQLDGTLQLAVDDLEIAIGLDSNADRQVTWGEILQAGSAIDNYIEQRLIVSRNAAECSVNTGSFLIATLAGGPYVSIPLSGVCENDTGALTVNYGLFIDVDSSHRGIAAIRFEQQSFNQVFASDRQRLELDGSQTPWLSNLGHFIYEGIWHIWIGIDHVLFIIAMLVGLVVHRQREAKMSARTISIEILKLVTAFTVAHSLTLIVATLGLVSLSPGFVESTIALTVVISGINIIYPLFARHHWQVAFVFGLIHGFGFANVLADLDLEGAQFLLGLLGFNIGVEIGQLAIVLLAAPLLLALSRLQWSQRYGRVLAGLLIAQIGVMWFLERI